MASAPVITRISVEEYLRTSFRPDVDFVDGVIEERNVGEWDHARLQLALLRILDDAGVEWGLYATQELRVQVSATRFRVPDVCVTDATQEIEQIPRRPPLLCIEVLSPKDQLNKVLKRAEDFLRMGVGAVWVFDPKTRRIWISTEEGVSEYAGGLLTVFGTPIWLDPQEAFARVDRRPKG